MESIYILIPIAIVLVCVAVGIFLWAVKSEQFEDLERQGHNVLFDDETPVDTPVSHKTSSHKTSVLNQKDQSGDA
ncbi:cbb3-type cytochrome oxidase assembly protein CcoS [Vibrio hippocampi]|uniref:Cbb3-type cytochrome oxidase assembly protein CcoS n=1 Tax=Vibrio hippocampi TaxID=654686 RepID=A0ABM8ZI10_9VIBR|nr:cbb3-type cytochrome oxidase assembly protein CcoS [Vibrio hippocampi]CAH0525982.1 hypothetical protein VHP8226_01464 [Vibrio hippocampi]